MKLTKKEILAALNHEISEIRESADRRYKEKEMDLYKHCLQKLYHLETFRDMTLKTLSQRKAEGKGISFIFNNSRVTPTEVIKGGN